MTARTLYEIKGVIWEYSYEGKHLEKRLVFKRLQKTGRVCADLMSGGRLFQSRLPAAVKARWPKTRMVWLPDGKKISKICLFVLT